MANRKISLVLVRLRSYNVNIYNSRGLFICGVYDIGPNFEPVYLTSCL